MSFFRKIFNNKNKDNGKKSIVDIKDTDSFGDIATKLASSGIISVPKDNNHNTFGQELDKLIDGELPWG